MRTGTDTPLEVLLVEDNPGDARLAAEAFASARIGTFTLTHAERLTEALELLQQRSFDAIVLDLSLPDSSGLDTLQRVLHHAPDIPVVVLTMLSDELLGVQAVNAGAQDYLQKDGCVHESLARSVRYAVERQRLLRELQHARQQEQLARNAHEIAAVEQLSHDTRTSVTAQLYSALPLRDAQPDLFSELVAQYGHILDQRLEQRAYKIETNTSDTLREIANQLGFLRAGPRDVVDVHTHAIRQRVRGASVMRMQAYVEEGRLLVLELMGYLVSYYRAYALGGIH
jgi:CheY-like chemotaxis protein